MTSRATTVAIVGAGIGGVYLAAHLGVAGCQLRLTDLDDSRLAEIRAARRPRCRGKRRRLCRGRAGDDRPRRGGRRRRHRHHRAPAAMPRKAVARSLAPLLRDGQLILLDPGQHRRLAGRAPRARRGGLPRRGRYRRDRQLPLFLPAAGADPDRADRRQALAADRRLSRQPHRGGVRAPGAAVPAGGRGAEHRLHRLHQRQRDAARRQLRRQCRADRKRRRLQILRRGRDAGGRASLRGDQRRARRGRRRASAPPCRTLPTGSSASMACAGPIWAKPAGG